MMPKSFKIIAVVVTYNRADYLKLCVYSLIAQTIPPELILVVDNASDEPVDGFFSDLPSVHVIRNDVNLGGSAGFSIGLSCAISLNCDWAWLMDDDAIPEPNALECLVDSISLGRSNVGAFCSIVYEFERIAVRHRRNFDRFFGLEWSITGYSDNKSITQVDLASFVGFLVSSEAVRDVGYPNDDFFLAYDDSEYSLRLMRAGWKIFLVPSSVINHLRSVGSRMRGTVFGPKHYYNIRNRLYVVRQYCVFTALASLIAVFTGLIIWFFSRDFFKFKSVRLLFLAISDGLGGKLGKLI